MAKVKPNNAELRPYPSYRPPLRYERRGTSYLYYIFRALVSRESTRVV